jgi:hypothetical protein
MTPAEVGGDDSVIHADATGDLRSGGDLLDATVE